MIYWEIYNNKEMHVQGMKIDNWLRARGGASAVILSNDPECLGMGIHGFVSKLITLQMF